MSFARAYLVTARPYLCFVSGATGLVGLATTRALGGAALAALGLAFFAAYGFGQALTDVTQLDTDRLSAPYRPLVRGDVRPRDVALVSVAGLLGCAAILLALHPRAAIAALPPIAGLATYTPLKRRFWGGPIHNGWIVATLPVLGALADRTRSVRAIVDGAPLGGVVLTAFFGYVTFVLLGYLKDVEADRATGYATLPVRFGRRATTAVSLACAAAALAVALGVVLRSGSAAALLAWALAAGLFATGHARAWSVTRDADAHRAIVPALRGFVALELAEAIALRPAFVALALPILAGFELALARRPCTEQV